MANGEFLVVVALLRYAKNRDNDMNLKQSFMFRVIPGEPTNVLKQRIGEYGFTD